MSAVVVVRNLTKRYGQLVAVNDVSFSIEKGEVFGLLGPNGAGKTTTVEMIEGLRKPDSGSIEVCSIDALKEPGKIKEIIGVQLQSTTLYDKIRERMRSDLYFTLHFIFGKTFLDAPFHANYAQFVWSESAHPQTIELAPRGGGKSTIGMAKMAAKFLLNPDVRQLLVSYDLNQAVKFLDTIYDQYLMFKPPNGKEDWIARLFPDVRRVLADSQRTKREWFFKDLNFSGKADPHFMAASINSGITGMHVDIEVDDLIDENNSRSPAECERAIEWMETSINVLEHQVRGNFHVRGTHYHLRDPYAHILENMPNFYPYIHQGLLESSNEDGTTSYSSYWESKFSVSDLMEMKQRMGSYKFSALIQQNPVQYEGAPFREEWLRYWEWEPGQERAIRLFDPSGDSKLVKLSDMTIATIYDPALPNDNSRSHTANVAVGMDADGNYVMLQPWEDRVSPAQGVRTFVAMGMQWEPDVMCCEEVLFSELFLPMFTKAAKDYSLAAYNIQPVKPAGRSKPIRILALQAVFEEGRVYVHRKHDNFITQYLSYPHGKRWDLLDAFAYAPDVLYPPQRTTITIGPYTVPRGKLMVGKRNRITGY